LGSLSVKVAKCIASEWRARSSVLVLGFIELVLARIEQTKRVLELMMGAANHQE